MKLRSWFWLPILVCAGCGVRGTHTDFVRYEAKEDSFVHLHSWTNIHCAKPSDLDHVQLIWKRRESIIIAPIEFLTVPAIERTGGHSYRWIDLDSSRSNPITTDAAIDFDSIRIIPGEFYQDEHGRLGYHHTEVIPGETMNAIAVASLSALAGAIEGQLDKSKVAKKPMVTWDEFRESTSHALDLMAGVTESPKPKRSDGTLPFDATSLKMLQTASTERSIQLTRIRDQFVIVVPLSSEDSKEAVTTFDMYRAKLAQLVKDGRPMGEVLAGAEAISMKAVGGTGLEMTVQFSELAKAWNRTAKGTLEEPLKMKEGDNLKYKETIKSIEQRGIPVSPSKLIGDVIADFFP
ncbi:MAG: hypothetical protein JWP89_5589 [Schlesneria sp.]|nr:hypothetical protein [Schlesneria sp.]